MNTTESSYGDKKDRINLFDLVDSAHCSYKTYIGYLAYRHIYVMNKVENENEIEGYELFEEQILHKNQEADSDAPKKPLEVESIKFEDMSEELRKEQEQVYLALEDKYCVCNHSKEKHTLTTTGCAFRAARFHQGRMENFKCNCPKFVSRKERRLEVEAASNA